MPKDTLTQQDIDQLGWLLNDRDDRTAFYLHYYELTGNEQVLAMAKISQLTEFEGAVAQRGNEVVQEQHPDLYPPEGVIQFSHEVAPHLYTAITKDFYEGTHTGVLENRAVLESAREAWDARGLGDQFLGNPLLAAERAKDFDFKEAWDALDSDGTTTAAEAAIYTVIPDISGKPDPAQSPPENASYHVTEDGKVGFYVSPETGHIVGVFNRPTDPETEPPIESRGIVNTFPAPEHPIPDPTPTSTGWKEEPISFHEQPTQSNLFDEKPDDAWAGVSPFAAGVALGQMANPHDHAQPQSSEAAPALGDQIQLPAGLRESDFGTGPTDYRSDFTDYLAHPPEGVNPVTLAVVSEMNASMVDSHVPMTHQHYEDATASLARGDSVVGFLDAENLDVLESTGSGAAYGAGHTLHEVIGYLNHNDLCVVPAVNPPTAPVDEQSAINGSPAFHEQPAHSYLFGENADDAWSGTNPFTAAVPHDYTPPQYVETAPALSDQIQLPAGLLNTDFGTGGTAPDTHDYDHQSALPDAFQASPVATISEPASEQHSGGFLSDVQDFFGSFSAPPSHAESSDTRPAWGASHETATPHEPATPSVLDQVGSWFSSPPSMPEPVASAFEHDHGSAFAPSYQEDTGPSFGSLFGGGDNHASAFETSYQSGHSYESGYSHHDPGYSNHDSGYSHPDSGVSSHDSGASSHDSGGHDSGGHGGGHDAGGGFSE
jgi:hypothetical protein